GMMSQDAVNLLCDKAPFLAVNTQVNAGNHGFNTISKYHRADYISISEKELRLDVRSERGNISEIVVNTSKKLNCPNIMITRGQKGCLSYNQESGFFKVPALVMSTVDRVGAGDAVFAITSACVAQQVPMEVIGFIGNAVGAQAVGMVGNKRAVGRVPLFKHLESLLK
ncbi:MAG: PfkB family carbohydrate kinase, partial [Chloroflexota bacterium]